VRANAKLALTLPNAANIYGVKRAKVFALKAESNLRFRLFLVMANHK